VAGLDRHGRCACGHHFDTHDGFGKCLVQSERNALTNETTGPCSCEAFQLREHHVRLLRGHPPDVIEIDVDSLPTVESVPYDGEIEVF